MPRTSINYENTCFYRIVCKDLDVTDVYIGHTTDFRRRTNEHKARCSNPNAKAFNIPVYTFIREHEGWDNWDMILIERSKCEDALEARKQERFLIETLHATLNANTPSRTHKECNCIYHEKNRDKIHETQNTKVECPCGGSFTLANKAAHFKTVKHLTYIAEK